MSKLRSWLEQSVENPIEPDLPIIDAHHHCWGDTPPVEGFPLYGLEEILHDFVGAGHNVVGSVYVQSFSHYRTGGPEHLRPVGETETINAMAEFCDRIGGRARNICGAIVAYADLGIGAAVGEVLNAHAMAAADRFRGIRYRVSHDEESPQFTHGNRPHMLAEADFRRGFSELVDRDLLCEIVCFHTQIDEVSELARSFPRSRIVLDHCGGPMMVGRNLGRERDVLREWSASMRELAACPNVAVKIGGLNLPFTGLSFQGRNTPPTSAQLAERQGEFVHRLIDFFGPSRCMFESNFPVDMLGTSYAAVWNGFKIITDRYTPDERELLFSGTAGRVYRMHTGSDPERATE